MMEKEQLTAVIEAHVGNIRKHIAEIPDYPQPGISFKDITPILQDKEVFDETIQTMTEAARYFGDVDIVISPESRGFMFGVAVADRLRCGFVPARKPGKLPRAVIEESYGLEYGTNILQIHQDAICAGQRVLVIDDVLATGGTAQATGRLVERLGGIVAGYVFLMELKYLGETDSLDPDKIISIVKY